MRALLRTLRDLSGVVVEPYLCGCGRVTTRLTRAQHRAWLDTKGVPCRCGRRTRPARLTTMHARQEGGTQ